MRRLLKYVYMVYIILILIFQHDLTVGAAAIDTVFQYGAAVDIDV